MEVMCMEREDISMGSYIEAAGMGTMVMAATKQGTQLIWARYTLCPRIEAIHYLRLRTKTCCDKMNNCVRK